MKKPLNANKLVAKLHKKHLGKSLRISTKSLKSLPHMMEMAGFKFKD